MINTTFISCFSKGIKHLECLFFKLWQVFTILYRAWSQRRMESSCVTWLLIWKDWHGLSRKCCCVLVTQSCLTLYSPMDCSPPGSSVHGLLQARILELVSIPFSRGFSWRWGRTQTSCIACRFFTVWAALLLMQHKMVLGFWVSSYSTDSCQSQEQSSSRSFCVHFHNHCYAATVALRPKGRTSSLENLH